MDKRQIFAWRYAVRCGKRAQRIYGKSLIEEFRNSHSYDEAVQHLGLAERFRTNNQSTLRGIVRYALIGNPDGCYPHYDGLLSAEEANEIAMRHLRDRDVERRKKVEGIYSRTPEERREHARMAIRARGGTPWEDEQIEYLIKRIQERDAYLREGLLNTKKLAYEINEKFYQRREVCDSKILSRLICRNPRLSEARLIMKSERKSKS